MLAADVVGMFEERLRVTILFAFFVPGIVYLADAVGTQTETIVVRGLSLGVPIRSMISRELLAGLAIGAALAALARPLVWWRWGDVAVALTVGLSVFAPFDGYANSDGTAVAVPDLRLRPGVWKRPARHGHSGLAVDLDLSAGRNVRYRVTSIVARSSVCERVPVVISSLLDLFDLYQARGARRGERLAAPADRHVHPHNRRKTGNVRGASGTAANA
jgi:hypothetical protein